MAKTTTFYEFKAQLKDLDLLNAKLKEAQVNLKGLKRNTEQYAELSAQIGGITKKIDDNKNAIDNLREGGERLNKTGNRMVGIFKSASIAIVSAFAFRAIIGGLRGVIKTFSDFESQMAAVQAISGATDQEFKKLKESAEALGASTVFTASQVGELQEAYARLGFTAEEIISAQSGTIALAAATGESLGSSAETAGSVLRAFGLDAEQTGNVVDVMGASFTSSALNLERFTQSMKFVAPIARAAGFTFEETSAQLAILSNNGLSGSLAGNALKNIFLRLGDANSKLNKSLGRTVQGLPDLINALREMKDESFGLTEATELLDKRSAPAFLTLINNIEGLEEQLDILNNAEGAVSRMAAIRLDTLEGDFTLLKSASEGLGVAIGEVFSGSLRNAIDSLTQFLQNLSKNDTALKSIRFVVDTLVNSIKLYSVGLLIAKARTLVMAESSGKWGQALISLRGSLAAARNGTLTLSMSMHTLKAAIASTGIGALVIAAGALYTIFTQVSEATQEVVRNQERLNRSFGEDIEKAQLLNENSQERLDLLRKMKQEYPELIGDIDLEVASNEQLLKIMTLVNGTRAERLAIAAAQKEIDELSEETAEKDLDLRREKLQLLKEIDEKELKSTDTLFKRYTLQIERIDRSIQKNKELFEQQEKLLNDSVEFEKNILKEKQEKSEVFNVLALRDEKSYRFTLREGYLEDLEEFRKQKRSKQLELIKEKDAEIKAVDQIVDYRRLLTISDKGTTEQKAKVAEEITKLEKAMGSALIARAEDSSVSTAKLGINLQELKKYVTQLNAALKGEVSDPKGTIFDAGNLRKTKDRFKELIKLRAENVVSLDENEIAKVKAAEELQLKKLKIEKDGIVANIDDVANAQDILAKGDEKSIAEFIKKNRNKFESLKNLSNEEYQKLIDVDKSYYDERGNALQSMLDEEGEKFNTNTSLSEEVQKETTKKLNQLRVQDKLALQENEKAKTAIAFEEESKTIKGFFKGSKERLDGLKTELAEDLKLNQEALDTGLIDKATFDKNNLELQTEAAQEEQRIRDERVAKVAEMYGKLSTLALDFFNNRAELQQQKIQEEFDRSSAQRALEFERDVELAEARGQNTEAMKRAFDNREIELENQKEEKLTAIKRRQFQMDKVNSIIQATLDGYAAIVKVTSQTGLAAIGAAPIMSAFVAAQVAGIASQKFVGEQGGLVPNGLEKFGTGGMVKGARHAQGGVKFAVGGTVAELEGGEAVINRRSTAMFKPVLSAMNVAGGGKKFEQGGITSSTIAATRDIQGMITQREMTQALANAINTQKVIVSEADITDSQFNVEVQESLSTIF